MLSFQCVVDDEFVWLKSVCLFVGGEEQSEPLLEEVLRSSADVLLQWPGKTAEGQLLWETSSRWLNHNSVVNYCH